LAYCQNLRSKSHLAFPHFQPNKARSTRGVLTLIRLKCLCPRHQWYPQQHQRLIPFLSCPHPVPSHCLVTPGPPATSIAFPGYRTLPALSPASRANFNHASATPATSCSLPLSTTIEYIKLNGIFTVIRFNCHLMKDILRMSHTLLNTRAKPCQYTRIYYLLQPSTCPALGQQPQSLPLNQSLTRRTT